MLSIFCIHHKILKMLLQPHAHLHRLILGCDAVAQRCGRCLAIRAAQLAAKGTVQQCVKEMLGLAQGFALLGAQPLVARRDGGEALLEREGRNTYIESLNCSHIEEWLYS